MHIRLNAEKLDLVFPHCKKLGITPFQLVHELLKYNHCHNLIGEIIKNERDNKQSSTL